MVLIVKSKAFTLIELLVVVAIIGIIAVVGVTAFSKYQTIAKEKACFENFAVLKRMIESNYALCKLDRNGSINVKLQYTNHKQGNDRLLPCRYSFGTIAGETAKSFGNYGSSPYQTNLHYNIPIYSYIGDPPVDGGIAYYPESAGFMLRVKCNGKVKRYQWPISEFPN